MDGPILIRRRVAAALAVLGGAAADPGDAFAGTLSSQGTVVSYSGNAAAATRSPAAGDAIDDGGAAAAADEDVDWAAGSSAAPTRRG